MPRIVKTLEVKDRIFEHEIHIEIRGLWFDELQVMVTFIYGNQVVGDRILLWDWGYLSLPLALISWVTREIYERHTPKLANLS